MKAIVLLSGGMDSTTLLYKVKRQCDDVKALTIEYGQRHNKEVLAAGKTCQKLKVDWLLLSLHDLKKVMKGSALTDPAVQVPEGKYDEPVMKQTVVSNRNMILLSIAGAYAISLGYDLISYAAHTGDHAIYPDCRPEFFKACELTINIGNWGKSLKIYVPFAFLDKTQILREGIQLGVDYLLTWTCYKGDLQPCGKCGACVERAEAFTKVGIPDPLLKEVK